MGITQTQRACALNCAIGPVTDRLAGSISGGTGRAGYKTTKLAATIHNDRCLGVCAHKHCKPRDGKDDKPIIHHFSALNPVNKV